MLADAHISSLGHLWFHRLKLSGIHYVRLFWYTDGATIPEASKSYDTVGVCSSNSLVSRRGTSNLIYILAFILLILLTTSAYSTFPTLLYKLVQV